VAVLDRAIKVFWRAYSPLALFLGFAMLAILCALWLPFALIFHTVLPKRVGHLFGRMVIRLGLSFYLVFLTVFCGCRFKINLDSDETLGGASILVANHPSLLDAVIFLAKVPNTICVMKASLLDNPLLGAAARLAGFIRNADPFSLLSYAKEAVGEDAKLLLFPEGTRTTGHSPISLNQSAALLAARLRLPIRTFILRYDQSFLGKSQKTCAIPSLPMTISLEVGDVFMPAEDYAATTTHLESYFNKHLL
jgi:1-acyl-sn-glycerol-3-phosphate acyltransferase